MEGVSAVWQAGPDSKLSLYPSLDIVAAGLDFAGSVGSSDSPVTGPQASK